MTAWKTYSEGTFCFVTKTIVGWEPVFDSHQACGILIDALAFAIDHKSVRLHAYVIMPTHLHMILSAATGRTISNMMRDFGARTSKKLSEMLVTWKRIDALRAFSSAALADGRGNDFMVWQEGFHPIILKNEKFYVQKRDYIHNNPVRKGLAEKPEDWTYSSARNYILGDHSMIKIECL
jgi:putative transposase